jgi:hypothetical protein
MTTNAWRFSIMLLLIAILLAACNSQNIQTPVSVPTTTAPSSKPTLTLNPTSSPTAAPTSTGTPTPYPTITPTVTFTTVPTETDIPKPAALTGTISMSGGKHQPYSTSIELRKKNTFISMGKGKSNFNGVYKIDNIIPGTYELWVLITSRPAMISGCGDIAPSDEIWRMGISFGEGKALTMENAYLSKALMLIENLQSSDLIAQGFYAVLPDVKIESGIENKLDVTLICK